MQDLPILHISDFKPFLDQTFKVQFENDKILDAVLIDVTEHQPVKGIKRVPFTLIFRTNQKEAYYIQSTYILIHPDHGSIPIFLIPIGPDKDGMKYQAIFN